MKLPSALMLTALLTTTAALAAEDSGTAASSNPQPAKHMSLKACNKQADAKKLTGTDRTEFVKACHGSTGKKKEADTAGSS